MIRQTLMFLSVIWFACNFSGWAAGELPITKSARSSNPTLAINSFTGDNRIAELFREALRYADWFEIVDGDTADYRLHGTFSRDDTSISIGIQIGDSVNQSRVGFKQSARANASESTLIYSVVDEIIKRIFGNPGFCRSKIAYVKELSNRKEIWTADFHGANPTRLTTNNGLSVEPDWGGGTAYLVYTLYNRSSTDVVLVDMLRNRNRRLARSMGLNCGGAISNNNRFVAMTTSRNQNVDLYVLNLATGTYHQKTHSKGSESSPCWSPSDEELCYVSDTVGKRPMIYIMPAAGGKAERLLRIPEESVSPDWSPLSNKICFAVRKGRRYTIGVVDMNSGNRDFEILVNAAGDWETPSWAADGRHIVCTRTWKGKKSLYLVDSYYKKAMALKDYTGNDTLPSYSGIPQ